MVMQDNDSFIETLWKNTYRVGAIFAILVLLGTFLDVIIGNITGGNLSALPQTAVARFAQFQSNPWLGLYIMDPICWTVF